MAPMKHAPPPGNRPHWASAAKTGVGTAIGADSEVWFTLSHGIVTEVFYHFIDSACLRGMGFVVTDRKDFFSDELHDADSKVSYVAEGVPAFRLANRARDGRYEIEKTVLADPRRSTLLQQTRFAALQGDLADYALYVLVEPHLGNQGAGNTGWLGEYKGTPMLFATRDDYALALACSAPWLARSAGFLGASDGRLDLQRHKRMEWSYDRAEQGNVLLTAEVDLAACQGQFVLALGFGRDEYDAGHRARASLLQGFDSARELYVEEWQEWQQELRPVKSAKQPERNIYQVSAAVMRTHESKEFPGGIIASLATPWGCSKSDRDRGYHLVWARDMIQTVGGLLAVRAHFDARRVLFYLHAAQEADGHWPQNMLSNGRPNWNGIQLDETAFVILLVSLADREGALGGRDSDTLWEMVRKAAGYLVRNGPLTPLDRWEEEAGYFASTMPIEIAALLSAAALAEKHGEPKLAMFLQETADVWNAEIEALIYVTDTALAREAGVEGYYVRFALPDQRRAGSPAAGVVTLKNHRNGTGHLAVAQIVSPDALSLVRFGLRAADDPRIVNTVRVIDHLLKVDTPSGTAWRRYNEDGYGEHADGSPFDGAGIGRIWPLLAGERAHYELAAGRTDEAENLLRSMEGFANESGLISEQVWDAPDIPERQLHFGRPSGSAMPLVWAHAEYVKLRRSLDDGKIFDMPRHSSERFLKQPAPACNRTYWRFGQECETIASGHVLRLELLAPSRVHWSDDGWRTSHDSPTIDTGLGLHYLDLASERLHAGDALRFTFYWPKSDRWEGENFQVELRGP
ncbi:MAG TPA: glycoside hydrolase family 15 protein [Pirellulales bacterium]|nr:glycoside hydrolase family 15 protein [Pirellulales bacterium]